MAGRSFGHLAAPPSTAGQTGGRRDGDVIGALSPVLSASGARLAPDVGADLGARLGMDLGDIRIHTDAEAARSARGLRARAYTVGQHIAFADGAYQPSVRAGRRLIAHEVVHVVQQGSGRVGAPSGGVVGRGHASEAEADTVADALDGAPPARPARDGTGAAAACGSGCGAVVQRQAEDEAAARGSSELDAALETLRDAADWVPGLEPLVGAIDVIRVAYDLYQRRENILAQIVDAIDGVVQQVPAEADRIAREHLAGLSGDALEGATCVLSELGGLLVSLADNWREVILGMLEDMLVVPLLARSIPAIIDNVMGIADDLSAGEFGAAVDRVVSIMTEVNGIVGVVFLWFAILETLGLTGAGTIEPGGGNAVGAAAGATVAGVVGVALVSSVVATELVRVARGLQEMSENWEDAQLRQAGCRQVAEGVFTLAVTALLFFIGPSIQRFAQRIIAEARVAVTSAVRSAAAEFSGLAGPQLAPAGAGAGGAMPFSRGVPEPVFPEPARPAPRPAARPPVAEPTPTGTPAPTEITPIAGRGGRTPARAPQGSPAAAGVSGAAAEGAVGRAREGEEPAGPHRMKAQIQEDKTHYGSAVVDAANPGVGVTAREFELCQAAARDNARLPADPRTRKEQLPSRFVGGVNRAKSRQSQLIRTQTIPAGGIPADRVEDINELRVCFSPRSLNLVTCGGRGQVRLDVENLAGHNLREPG